MPVTVDKATGSSEHHIAGQTEVAADPSHRPNVELVGPYRLRGAVVHGFGRGSKLLGFPTANLDPQAFKQQLAGVKRGVYAGWCQLNGSSASSRSSTSPVYKTVLSLGTNPTFKDSVEETVEAYILHTFDQDFYGQNMRLIIAAYLRPSEQYNSMEELMAAISNDERIGDKALDEMPELAQLKHDKFFTADDGQ